MTTEKANVSQKESVKKTRKSTKNSTQKLTEAKQNIEKVQKETEEVKYDLDNI